MQSMLRWKLFIENSGLNMEEDRDRVGVIVSSGIGGLQNWKIKLSGCMNVG